MNPEPNAKATTPSGARRAPRRTRPVSATLFRQVYDSPASLPGEAAWVTSDADVRKLEVLLALPEYTIGAPLWVSGDRRDCPSCGRQVSWLDIVASALQGIHDRALISKVILGDQRFVNVEIPNGIAGVVCFSCGGAIEGIRSFKCHNWAYAHGDIARLVLAAGGA